MVAARLGSPLDFVYVEGLDNWRQAVILMPDRKPRDPPAGRWANVCVCVRACVRACEVSWALKFPRRACISFGGGPGQNMLLWPPPMHLDTSP